MENSLPSNSNDTGKLILRLAVGGLMLFHGIYKLMTGIGWMSPMLNEAGLPAFVAYGVYIGEVIAPLLIIAGWKTRLAAIAIVLNMIFAIWLAHRNEIFLLKQGGAWAIELDMFYLLTAVAIFFLGAGKYSISRGIGKFD